MNNTNEITETRYAIVSVIEGQAGRRGAFMCPVAGFGVDEFMSAGTIERAHLYKTEAGARRWIAGRGAESAATFDVITVKVAVRRGKVSHVVEIAA